MIFTCWKNNKILVEFVLSRENCCKCIESDQLLHPIIIIEMSIPIWSWIRNHFVWWGFNKEVSRKPKILHSHFYSLLQDSFTNREIAFLTNLDLSDTKSINLCLNYAKTVISLVFWSSNSQNREYRETPVQTKNVILFYNFGILQIAISLQRNPHV